MSASEREPITVSAATAAIDSIGSTRLRKIVCPNCSRTFPRWYRGNLRVGSNYLTDIRLSGYRLLGSHLEDDHEDDS